MRRGSPVPPEQPRIPASERGAALLVVLLIVSVIAVLAATALERLRLTTRLGGNAIALDQARAYAMGAEALTMQRVEQLLTRDGARVTLDGGWSGRPFSFTVPGGVIAATLTDGGNCFNLNSLVTRPSDDSDLLATRPEAVAQFARPMPVLGVPAQQAGSIAAATADWIDSDNDQQAQGAEDGSYARGEVRYATGGTLMSDPSELRAVVGVTPQIYAKLAPWICALPEAKPSRINVNTLTPEQAPLVAMLLPDTLDIAGAHAVLLERPPQGFASVNAFWNVPSKRGITADGTAQQQASVTSGWFNLQVDVVVGDTRLTERSLIDARRSPVQIVSRAWGDPA